MSTATDPLAVLGVRVTDPLGEVKSAGGWTAVGMVILSAGDVEAAPRHGLTDTQRSRLLAAAGAVWLHGLDAFSAESWAHHPNLGAVVEVWIRDPEGTAECHEAAERYCVAGGVR